MYSSISLSQVHGFIPKKRSFLHNRPFVSFALSNIPKGDPQTGEARIHHTHSACDTHHQAGGVIKVGVSSAFGHPKGMEER